MAEKPLKVGARVRLSDKNSLGTVAYVGTTLFSQGKWIGVVLDDASGKNNGTVQGKEYFKCPDNHGIFVRPAQLITLDDENENVPVVEEKTPAAATSGLKQPQTTTKKPSFAETSAKEPSPSTESKMKLPTATRSKLPAAGSQEKLKSSPSVEKLAAGAGIRPSPSSEKLAGVKEVSEQQKKSQLPKGSAIPTAGKEMPQPQKKISPEKEKIDEDDASASNVAAKISKIQLGMQRPSMEGIVRIAPANLSEGAELEYLRAEAKDLSEKLETLRAKRLEDKQKLIDYEKCKIQLQQLLEYKTKMNEIHGELQKQVQHAKKDAKEAIEARENYQDEMSGLSEAIEMATLDKEMAEERADMLQQEVEALKDKVQELEADLEILKHDMEEKGGEAGAATAYQVKQLEQQNERLKDAVIKMRDLSAHERKETQRLTKELETLKSTMNILQQKNEKLSEENQKFEQQMMDLKEQIDASLGSESMIEQLTTRNLALEERVRELEETVEDFEQMKQMDEELQESAKEVERDLRRELDLMRRRIHELEQQLKKSHGQISDHEKTIDNFRELTSQLQRDIRDLKDSYRGNREIGDGEGDETTESSEERATRVQGKIEKMQQEFKKKQTEFETSIISMKEKIVYLESENTDLKEKVKTASNKSETLQWQASKKDNEVLELKKALRLKLEEISEMNVRKEMAEKKLATSGKEGDERIIRLEKKIEEIQQDYKKKEREFEQTMDSLQQEIDNLETENSDLKERIKMMSKKALLQGISAQSGFGPQTGGTAVPTAGTGLPSPIGTASDSPMLLQQIENLKTALLLTREEKCAVEAEKMNRTLASLPPLNVPKKMIGLSSTTGLTDLDQLSHKRHDELNHLVRETARLQKEFQNYASDLKVIDISKRKPGSEPTLDKQTPAYQLSIQLQRAKKLNDWVQDLQLRMKRYRAVQLCGNAGAPGSDFGRFPPLGYTKTENRDSFPILARISVPVTSESKSDDGKIVPVYVSDLEFLKLHKTLVV